MQSSKYNFFMVVNVLFGFAQIQPADSPGKISNVGKVSRLVVSPGLTNSFGSNPESTDARLNSCLYQCREHSQQLLDQSENLKNLGGLVEQLEDNATLTESNMAAAYNQLSVLHQRMDHVYDGLGGHAEVLAKYAKVLNEQDEKNKQIYELLLKQQQQCEERAKSIQELQRELNRQKFIQRSLIAFVSLLASGFGTVSVIWGMQQ